jgi:histidinol-phosphate aminotransferase
MPDVKIHLKNLYRTHSEIDNRMNYLRLDMNENVEGLPDGFVKSILAEIDGNFMATYPEYHLLEEKLADHINLDVENICLSNGSDAAIKYIFDAYISAGDKILLTDPTFAMYPVYSQMFDANISVVEYNSDMLLSAAEFCKMISNETRLAVIVNPNNPTGNVLPRNDIIKILDKALETDTLLIVDEAYFYYYPETVIDLITRYSNLIVLRTFSKLCGIAAARLGYAVACPEIVDNLIKVKPTYDVNGLAVLFAKRLLDRPDLIHELIKSVTEGKDFLVQKLSAEGIEHHAGYANFMLIKCGKRATEVARRLEEKNMLVSSGFRQVFLKDYIRVTVGNRGKMQRFLEEFVKIWRNQLG